MKSHLGEADAILLREMLVVAGSQQLAINVPAAGVHAPAVQFQPVLQSASAANTRRVIAATVLASAVCCRGLHDVTPSANTAHLRDDLVEGLCQVTTMAAEPVALCARIGVKRVARSVPIPKQLLQRSLRPVHAHLICVVFLTRLTAGADAAGSLQNFNSGSLGWSWSYPACI